MKKYLFTVLVCSMLSVVVFAQKYKGEDRVKGFQRSNLFTGGGVALSLGSGYTSIGLNPYFGYSFTKWLDAAVSVNYNYLSQRDVVVVRDKVRQSITGPGAFIRLFPVNILFAQAQYERNFMSQKYIGAPGDYNVYTKQKFNANSLLVGLGYSNGKQDGKNSYYYFSLSFDVLKDKYSPYLDSYGRTVPIFRAGYNIGLFQKDK